MGLSGTIVAIDRRVFVRGGRIILLGRGTVLLDDVRLRVGRQKKLLLLLMQQQTLVVLSLMMRRYDHGVLVGSALGVVAEALGEWIIVDLELCDVGILVGGDGHELSLHESERLYARVIVYGRHVYARHVLVHGIEYDL